ncbi:Lateral flagellin [Massilia sp. P8910]|uniref:Flagellin n=1 Tax=Massilia antarctica TaxID=2765360 RepID=A0AA48WJH5_9BURK|nr:MULTISPECIES: flagellin [Massilia]CUI07797.1 Flagellin protein FlaA [Janthinobacterium sp. CG23_2]MCE3606115.1 Lateral flagellin [Massilia antarctica]MCY0913194.1 flagellin [Massilia sp. H27-R4]QPI52694.1 Lateral flagellin [Massilia antarctica]CUU31583.1 Flagellin protein FlaA [Janthinobacterium sp. CG23_2]
MLSLHTNNAALSAQNSINRTQGELSTSMTRLSTGYRINSSMDDAAGLQIATRLKAQTSGMAVAMRNTQNSTSMLQTAEGALDEVSNMMVRMKDLATQAADASSTGADKTAMQSEYDALGTELNNVLKNTSFGGAKLLVGGTIASAMTFQIGSSTSEKMTVNMSADMTTLVADVTATTANYVAPNTVGTELTGGGASATIDLLSTAIASIGTVRSGLGASANRLEHVYNNLSNISTNSKAATGRIMDVDFASESSKMTTSQMLLQAGTSMLKQSNSMSSMVMSLLQ